MSDFSNFHQLYQTLQSQDNDQIAATTDEILALREVPGFSEALLQMLVTTEDESYQAFITIEIVSQIKNYWETEQLYQDKEEFRNNLLDIMTKSTGVILNNISEAITIISQYDFPDKWPSLMSNLTSVFQDAELPTIYATLFTSSKIIKRYERQASSDPILREIENIAQYWGEAIDVLLSEILPNQPECDELVECYNFCFQIIRSLCAIDMPKYIYEKIDTFFSYYHNFFNIEGIEEVKITLCQIMKQHIIRYLSEIKNWGTDGDEKKSEEEIQNVQALWFELYNDLLNTMSVNISEDSSDQLIISVFDALTALARSNDREFFVQGDNLENFCSVLIPCISLSDDDVSDFYNDSLNYFQRDIEGLESESRRMSARNFLKVLGRNFRDLLAQALYDMFQQISSSFNQSPDDTWKDMDTGIFLMDIIVAKTTHYTQGVKEVIDGFDLAEFLSSFIFPLLGGNYPLLQADALKFLVDFRMVIEPQTVLQAFHDIAQLLFEDESPVSLYAAYFIDKILSCVRYADSAPEFFQTVNIADVVTRLFYLFNIYDKLNIIAARCLMRIVVHGNEAIQPQIFGIISTCVNFLKDECAHPSNAFFDHCLFEIIVASVTKANVPVPEIEEGVFELLGKILEEDVSEFVPYVYQIIGCFLFHYPGDALSADGDSFYAAQFGTFLEDHRWMAMGNIPALAILIRAYCFRLPVLVANNMDQILVICNNLLQGTRSHPHAFMIFVSIVRFMSEIAESVLPQIYSLVISQLSNPELRKYRQSFAIFMSNCCFFLGPDEALSLLPGEDAENAVLCWAESLPLVRGRSELECAISGCMKTLLESSVLSQEMWEALFVGTVRMIEMPSYDAVKDDIELIKIEEQDAKQFDTTFNKLIYAELKDEINPHPELEKSDLVRFMVEKLAEYFQGHPGYLNDMCERNILDPHLKNSFLAYQKRYGITFA